MSALLAAALLLPGCGTAMTSDSLTDPAVISENVTAGNITLRDASEDEPFVFNPHAYSSFLEICYPEDYRDAFFNLCDALSEGRDTFECPSKEAYEFCMEPATLDELYPVACKQIIRNNDFGDAGYENGTGHIRYEIPVGEYLERQEAFMREITDILNSNVRSYYTDLEKCLVLYDYMSSNYQYDHMDEVGQSDDGACYSCFRLKKGICNEIGTLYAYLLMQCGVDAIAVQNDGIASSAGYHAWTFVNINGENYHIDVTAALLSETGMQEVSLDYFLMTDSDRDAAGYIYDELEVPLLHVIYANECREYEFVARDDSYRLPDGSYCTGYDTEKNVIYYKDSAGEHEFRYE
ncbi:MAG: hypothetical protein IKG03_01930 [Clostridiales bacterium]|nr:hypothetical protein [Clostridiales bacterium]